MQDKQGTLDLTDTGQIPRWKIEQTFEILLQRLGIGYGLLGRSRRLRFRPYRRWNETHDRACFR